MKKAPSLVTAATAAFLVATSLAFAQNENVRQPNPEANAPAGQQPNSSQGLGTGSSAGDAAAPSATTGQGMPAPNGDQPAAQVPGGGEPKSMESAKPGDRAQ